MFSCVVKNKICINKVYFLQNIMITTFTITAVSNLTKSITISLAHMALKCHVCFASDMLSLEIYHSSWWCVYRGRFYSMVCLCVRGRVFAIRTIFQTNTAFLGTQCSLWGPKPSPHGYRCRFWVGVRFRTKESIKFGLGLGPSMHWGV